MDIYTPLLKPNSTIGQALQEAIVLDIRKGTLPSGTRLPGTRTLALRLGLSRGTVTRALSDLTLEGWLVSSPGAGFYVHGDVPKLGPTVRVGNAIGFDLRHPLPTLPTPSQARFKLLGGHPDLRILPVKELGRAYSRVLRRRAPIVLDYGDPRGDPKLLHALGDWLASTRGVRPQPGGLMVTRGSQMGLHLAGQVLLRPGDRVGVESLGYRPAWTALEAAGAELVPLALDAQGLRVDTLTDDLRAVYLTPHHQFPTGATLSASRRERLLSWAARTRTIVIEDDYDHEFHYEGRPIRPLVAADTSGVVVSIGTLSKAFAPGLRVGWVVGHPDVLTHLVHRRRSVDRQGDRVVEHAMAELMEDGLLDRHLRRARRVYRDRRDTMIDALATHLPMLEFDVQPGGLALWCHAPDQDVDAWAARAESVDVHVETANKYTLDGSSPSYIRLGFAGHDHDELREAVRRLASVY